MSSVDAVTRSGWLKPALWIPWQDRNGRFSALHGIMFLLLLVPGIVIAVRWAIGDFQPRPVNEVVHQTGLWAIRILFISLVITPLRQGTGFSKLIVVRRMIGVTAFAYALIHLLLYALDESFNLFKIATEILVRYYLLIGFCALILLGVLAATSTTKAIRNLGGKHWQNVHRLVYAVAVLAVAHHYMQSKVNVTEPVIMTGLLIWLMGYRLLARQYGPAKINIWMLLGLILAATLLTALSEYAYYELFTGVPGSRVLQAYLIPPWEQARPAWIVLMILIGWRLIGAIGKRFNRSRRPA